MKKLLLILCCVQVGCLRLLADSFYNEAVVADAITVTTSAANITGFTVINLHTAAVYVHVYNARIANVTVGTTQTDYIIPVPASGAVVLALNNANQYRLPKGIVIAVTTSPLSSGSTAPGTAAVVHLQYGPMP